MRPKKFNFISVNQILSGEGPQSPVCSFNKKTSMLAISNKNQDVDKFKGAMVRLFVDAAKNTIAWKFLPSGTDVKAAAQENGIYQFKEVKNEKTGTAQVKIYIPKKLASQIDFTEKSYKSLPIQKYQDSMIEGVEPYYYVTFESKSRKNNVEDSE